jgi:hypothetical protein
LTISCICIYLAKVKLFLAQEGNAMTVDPGAALVLESAQASAQVARQPTPGGAPRAAAHASMRQAILRAPILPTMLGLALPTIAVLAIQTLVGIAETFYVSFLGTDALAGVSLVFPVLMLMMMMSNGGIGGGVASAIARAIATTPTRWCCTRSSSPLASAWRSRPARCCSGRCSTARSAAMGRRSPRR